MYPNSRSPCAAWFRFMKSKSIVAHGSSALAWVWRWSNGLSSADRPAIHILAGLNVCIHVMTPTTCGAALTASIVSRIASRDVSTGFQTMRHGTSPQRPRSSTTLWDWVATWARIVSPYMVWLPVRNQTSSSARSGTMLRLIRSLPLAGVRLRSGGLLSVDVLISIEERVDVGGRDRDGCAELSCQVDGAGDVLAHDRCLDGRPRCRYRS